MKNNLKNNSVILNIRKNISCFYNSYLNSSFPKKRDKFFVKIVFFVFTKTKQKLRMVLIILLISHVGCTPKIQFSSAYEEDLSIHRPDYPAPVYNLVSSENSIQKSENLNIIPTHHIKDELDSVLHSIILSKKHVRFINGFSIQVYSGNNRDKATLVKRKVQSISKDFKPKIKYSQPNYKVKVGKYFSRIEANKDLVVLKKKFKQALLVPAKILIE